MIEIIHRKGKISKTYYLIMPINMYSITELICVRQTIILDIYNKNEIGNLELDIRLSDNKRLRLCPCAVPHICYTGIGT